MTDGMTTIFIFWSTELVGRLSHAYASPALHCPLCRGKVQRVLDTSPQDWQYFCVPCSQLVVPIELIKPLSPAETQTGAVGRVTAVRARAVYPGDPEYPKG